MYQGSLLVLSVFCVSVFCVSVFCDSVSGQDNIDQSTTDSKDLKDKAILLADTLVKHPQWFEKLLKIADAGGSLLNIGSGDPNVEFVKEYALDHFSDFFNSSFGLVDIVMDELYRVDISDVIASIQRRHLSPDDFVARTELLNAIFDRYDKFRTIRRILTLSSARNYLPLTNETKMSSSCYNDVIHFIDALAGVAAPPIETFTFSTPWWAQQMVDAFGKPPSGILNGAREWAGSEAECQKVHAHLEAGLILGNNTLQAPVQFKGQFCTATLSLPSTIQNYLNKSLPGSAYFQFPVQKSFRWDMCVPDSCSQTDVEQFLQLGLLRSINVVPTTVECRRKGHTHTLTRSLDFAADKNSGEEGVESSLPFLQQCGKCPGAGNGLDQDGWWRCTLAILDENNDGAVTKEEWYQQDKGRARARHFLLLDANQNHVIDNNDFNHFFRTVDLQDDGRLSLKEFTRKWKSTLW